MTPDEVKEHLLKDVTKLEKLASRYQMGGFTIYEVAKLSIYSAYTLIRAAEPLENAADSDKKQAITEVLMAIIGRYPIDTPLPEFFDQMIRGLLVNTLVRAAFDVLFRHHYQAPA
jgi:hypothetical protein